MTKKATPLLNQLLDEVQAALESHPARKAELLSLLSVSRIHIYKWIVSREHEPGGEVTLMMQKWLARITGQKPPQPQTKRARSVITTARPSTSNGVNDEEENQSRRATRSPKRRK